MEYKILFLSHVYNFLIIKLCQLLLYNFDIRILITNTHQFQMFENRETVNRAVLWLGCDDTGCHDP